jgi:hypothetical protein
MHHSEVIQFELQFCSPVMHVTDFREGWLSRKSMKFFFCKFSTGSQLERCLARKPNEVTLCTFWTGDNWEDSPQEN